MALLRLSIGEWTTPATVVAFTGVLTWAGRLKKRSSYGEQTWQ